MEVYIINVLLSWFPYLMGVIAVTLALFFTKDVLRIPPFKTGLVLLFASFFFAALQSGNTYKFKVNKSPNPVLKYSEEEIKEIPPLIEQGKEDRKQRFEDLTNWKSRIQ